MTISLSKHFSYFPFILLRSDNIQVWSSWFRPEDKDTGVDEESHNNLSEFESLGFISGDENIWRTV